MRDIAYREAHRRLKDIARSLDDRRLATRVPACPLWSVKDLYAHLVGGPADGAAGRPIEPWNPEWTQSHVERRKDRTIEEILDEWEPLSPLVQDLLKADSAPPAHHDILNHEADIRGALGLPRLPGPSGWRVSFDESVQRISQRIGGPGRVEFHCEGEVYAAGDDGGPVSTAEVEPYELWRACYGRRSPRQMGDWKWSGDAQPYITALPIFGPTEEDLTEPGPEVAA